MSPYRVILVTCPDAAVERIAGGLLERRLVACVNAIRGVASRYVWKGKVESAEETLLVLKARAEGFEAIAAALRELHPYELPEILALPVAEGSGPYLRWIDEVIAPPAPRRRRREA